MEEFYSLLRLYNKTNADVTLPEWTKIFSEPNPPAYWSVLKNILAGYSKESSIFEIGSGAGDILALVRSLGFSKVIGIEKEERLAKVANKKIEHFFQKANTVINDYYPISILQPNILIQVNCVYFDNIATKHDYLQQLKSIYINTKPDLYLLEVIDSSFKGNSKSFPNFVRLSEDEIQRTFNRQAIQSYITYQFPNNTTTKRLYVIA